VALKAPLGKYFFSDMCIAGAFRDGWSLCLRVDRKTECANRQEGRCKNLKHEFSKDGFSAWAAGIELSASPVYHPFSLAITNRVSDLDLPMARHWLENVIFQLFGLDRLETSPLQKYYAAGRSIVNTALCHVSACPNHPISRKTVDESHHSYRSS
jgi:hypothetical protein